MKPRVLLLLASAVCSGALLTQAPSARNTTATVSESTAKRQIPL